MKKLMFPCRCPLRAKRLFKFLGMKLPEEKSICVMGCNEKTVEQSAKPTDMIRKVINQKRREILQNMDPITVLKKLSWWGPCVPKKGWLPRRPPTSIGKFS